MDKFAAILPYSPKLAHLSIHGWISTPLPERVLHATAKCQQLESLVLRNIDLECAAEDALARVLPALPKLHRLGFDNMRHASRQNIAAALMRCTALDDFWCSNAACEHAWMDVAGLPGLRQFSLENVTCCESDSMRQNPDRPILSSSLRALLLLNNYASEGKKDMPDSFKSRVIRDCSRLCMLTNLALSLAGKHTSDPPAELLASALPSLTALQTLWLDEARLSGTVWDALPKCAQLRHLAVHSCSAAEEHFPEFAAALAQCRQLTQLKLTLFEMVGTGDAVVRGSLKPLFTALPRFAVLRRLSVSFLDLADIANLVACVRDSPCLTTVNLQVWEDVSEADFDAADNLLDMSMKLKPELRLLLHE